MFGFVARALRELARNPALFAGLMAALLFQGIYMLGSPLTLKFIFDEGVGQGRTDILFLALGAWAGLLAVFALGTIGQEFAAARLGVGAMNRLRQRMFEKMQELPPNSQGQRAVSSLVGTFGNDMGQLETALVRGVPVFALSIAASAISLALLFVIDWRLALVTVGSLGVIVGLPKVFGGRAERLGAAYAQAGDRLLALAQESAVVHPIVTLFSQRRRRAEAFAAHLDDLAAVGPAAHVFVGLVGRTAFIGTGLSQLVVLGTGGYLAIQGSLTAGLLLAFVGLLLRIGDAVSTLSTAVPLILPAMTARKRIDAFLDQPIPALESPQARKIERLSGRIAFEGVTFGYDDGAPTIKDLTLAIEPGERVAFVGPSGSGKSTVMALLLRLYRAQRGRILLDGHPIEDVREDSLRDNMSVVPQNAILFEASVRDNILIGRPGAAEAEILEAAKAAGVHEAIVAKPEGYGTLVSTGGQLSGGERQRVATARAFLRDAPILLLDEATSALDPSSEEVVNRSVTNLAGRKTVISVTHRLASVAGFDRIFVLRDGQLAESGRHQELLAKRGLYAELWSKQHGFHLATDDGEPSVTADRLALVPFLAQCRPDTLEELARLFAVERFREGATVFRQGNPGDKFYLVAHGTLEVRREADSGGTERVLAALQDGDFFGEVALVNDSPRTASIRAATDSWCLALPRQHFLTLLKREQTVRESVRAAVERIQGNGPAPAVHEPA